MAMQVLQCTLAAEAFHWEALLAQQPPEWLNSRQRDNLEPCLSCVHMLRCSAQARIRFASFFFLVSSLVQRGEPP